MVPPPFQEAMRHILHTTITTIPMVITPIKTPITTIQAERRTAETLAKIMIIIVVDPPLTVHSQVSVLIVV